MRHVARPLGTLAPRCPGASTRRQVHTLHPSPEARPHSPVRPLQCVFGLRQARPQFVECELRQRHKVASITERLPEPKASLGELSILTAANHRCIHVNQQTFHILTPMLLSLAYPDLGRQDRLSPERHPFACCSWKNVRVLVCVDACQFRLRANPRPYAASR